MRLVDPPPGLRTQRSESRPVTVSMTGKCVTDRGGARFRLQRAVTCAQRRRPSTVAKAHGQPSDRPRHCLPTRVEYDNWSSYVDPVVSRDEMRGCHAMFHGLIEGNHGRICGPSEAAANTATSVAPAARAASKP